MTKFDQFLDRLNFKKLFKLYLLISAALFIICVSTALVVSKDKIKMAISYKQITHSFEEKGMDNSLITQMNSFLSTSKDIKNVLVVDENDKLLYKGNNTLINNSKEFKLSPYGNYGNYLQDNINKKIIYKIDRDKDIIIDKNYIKNHREIEDEIDDSFSYERDLESNNIYLINYKINNATDNKLFIIREVRSIPYLERILEAMVLIFGLLFATYWIGLALWVYKDSNRKGCNASLWGLLTLITNIAGLIIYIIFKQNSAICSTCGSLQNRNNKYCSSCGSKISSTCNNCSSIVGNDDKYCKNCGHKLNENQETND